MHIIESCAMPIHLFVQRHILYRNLLQGISFVYFVAKNSTCSIMFHIHTHVCYIMPQASGLLCHCHRNSRTHPRVSNTKPHLSQLCEHLYCSYVPSSLLV